jgi:hypothetical protein
MNDDPSYRYISARNFHYKNITPIGNLLHTTSKIRTVASSQLLTHKIVSKKVFHSVLDVLPHIPQLQPHFVNTSRHKAKQKIHICAVMFLFTEITNTIYFSEMYYYIKRAGIAQSL